MVQVPFTSAARARSYGLPESSLSNLFFEATPGGPTPDVRLPRPGLASAYTWGTGPNRGLYRNPGVYSGGKFAVQNTTAYLDGASVGTVLGSDMVRWAASSTQVVAVAADRAYCYEGSTFVQIADPDLPTVVDVAFIGGRFVFQQKGSGRFFWSAVGDAKTVDGLSYSNAESNPDNGVGLSILGDDLVFHNQTSTEFWSQTGDDAAPFERAPSRRYQRGCIARDSIVQDFDNTTLFVGDNLQVIRCTNIPKRISSHDVEDMLRRCATPSLITAFPATFEGHTLYVLNIPGVGTRAYDVERDDWGEWASWNRTTFRGRSSLLQDGVNYVGDDTSNAIWALTPGVHLDGTDPLVRLASAFYPCDNGFERCDRITLQCVRGVGLATGQGSDPLVEMRYSDDMGRTWSPWSQGSLGKVGEYGKRATWRRQGRMKSPGRWFQFRTSDPVYTVFQSVRLNEDRS